MSKLYGPSDVQSVHLGDGHQHTFFQASDRELVPGYGNDKRSLPVIECDACAEWCKGQGWHPRPGKVQLTPDEREYLAEAREQGDLAQRLMAESMGRAFAEQSVLQQQNKEKKAAAATARTRVGARA